MTFWVFMVRIIVFVSILDIEWILLGFFWISFQVFFSGLSSMYPEEHFEELFNKLFLCFSDIKPLILGLWPSCFHGLYKNAFYVCRRIFWLGFVPEKKNVLVSISELEWKTLVFPRKYSGKGFETAIFISRGPFWWKPFFERLRVFNQIF